MGTKETPSDVSSAIAAEIQELDEPIVPNVRRIRQRYSRRLRSSDGEFVLAVARELYGMPDHSWVALELIRYHEPALALISEKHLREFGRRLESWGTVDAFAGFLAGPAWLRGSITDDVVFSWTRSDDRWWRRAALVSTVVLNSPNHGGEGDTRRTLAVCELLVEDRDDMVVKAMSWALRKLVAHDPAAVRSFLRRHEGTIAARVRREVNNKLDTGLKNPHRKRRGNHLAEPEAEARSIDTS